MDVQWIILIIMYLLLAYLIIVTSLLWAGVIGPSNADSTVVDAKRSGLEQETNNEAVKKIMFPIEGVEVLIGKDEGNNLEEFQSRRKSEAKFRELCMRLILPHLNPLQWILDVGCWKGDNTIPWAALGYNVLAVDPSHNNCEFIKRTAKLNNVHRNVMVVETGLGNKQEELTFKGGVDHLSFHVQSSGSGEKLKLQRLQDLAVVAHNHMYFGFLHLDVEGFELHVLEGATEVIERDSPWIVFETHFLEEEKRVIDIFILLSGYGYTFFMIPECCGASRECRNILAVPKHIPFDLAPFQDILQETTVDALRATAKKATGK